MIRRPPRSTPFPTRRSSDLHLTLFFFDFLFLVEGIRNFYGESVSIVRSEEHTSELQSQFHLVCRLFFFNDTATTEIYTFPYTTLFRSPPHPFLFRFPFSRRGHSQFLWRVGLYRDHNDSSLLSSERYLFHDEPT